MDFQFYFILVMLLWQRPIVEMDHGLFGVVGPYFLRKSHSTFKISIVGLCQLLDNPTVTAGGTFVMLRSGRRDRGNSDILCPHKYGLN